MSRTLRVMTFNIWGCARGIHKVADVINAQNPDIALLQEVHNGMPWIFSSDGEDQAAELAARTQLTSYRYGKAGDYRTFGGRGWVWGNAGNAIPAKSVLGPAIVHPVDPPVRNRSYLQVRFDYYGITHQLICMHWGLNDEWIPSRDKAIELVRSFPIDTPQIVAGDFNATANDPNMLPFLSLPGLVDVASAIPDSDPCLVSHGNRIDYIVYRGPYQQKSVSVRCDPPDPSDHPAIVADLDFPTAPSLPTLAVSIQPRVIPLKRPVQVIVTARDAATQAPVSGMVSIDGQDIGATDVPFTYTFDIETIRRFDPDLKKWVGETIRPEGEVKARGYAPEKIPFRFQ